VEYPASLKKINDPPIVLYVKGEVRPADSLAIAVVGSRQASYYGKRQSESLSFALAQIGITVVSGLARGIDAFAHEGAMKAHGRTIAVVGSGLADPYPRENRALADRIAQCGAVVSEFPLDFPVRAENFPRRNRIIAGLSLGVVVVEAALRSGSLITARWAAEQGKDVFAVPGNVDSPSSRGCHQLLKDGAKLVEDVGDILEELGPLVEAIVFRDESALKDSATGPAMKLALSENESKVYAALSTEPMNVEEIIDLSGLSVQAVSAALSLLVLKRFAVRLPGQMYVKTVRSSECGVGRRK
jgi:DNA processing protein